MAGNAESRGGGRGNLWRLAPWAIATLLLLLPLVAMRFTDAVAWDGADFVVAGALLFGACGVFELAARTTGGRAYRAAVGLALAAALVLIWINLAVGVIGTADHPANLMYGGVLAIGVIGAIIARFRPGGMARALVATAIAQALVPLIVLIAGLASIRMLTPAFVLTGVFVALWLGSAWLFRRAAREQAPAGSAP